ncbi:MAG: hypothetical protein IPO78_17345 [Saprospiraceae bacterium]|nr:hypothetical protein [Saprospiraceae bacterium]
MELVKEIEKRKEQFANLAWEFAEKKVKVDKLEKEIAKAKEISDQNRELRKEIVKLRKEYESLHSDYLKSQKSTARMV